MMTSRRTVLVTLAAALLATLTLSPPAATAKDESSEALGFPEKCSQLQTDPRLKANPGIKTLSSTVISASGGNKAYCQVSVLYGTSPAQNINIAVGLPLNSVDGGTGGVQGAWNGRTQGIGGGGCLGNLVVNSAVNTGYVGSGTDGGHGFADFNCARGVNADGTYNLQFINDFFRNGIKEEILFSKAVAT